MTNLYCWEKEPVGHQTPFIRPGKAEVMVHIRTTALIWSNFANQFCPWTIAFTTTLLLRSSHTFKMCILKQRRQRINRITIVCFLHNPIHLPSVKYLLENLSHAKLRLSSLGQCLAPLRSDNKMPSSLVVPTHNNRENILSSFPSRCQASMSYSHQTHLIMYFFLVKKCNSFKVLYSNKISWPITYYGNISLVSPQLKWTGPL